MYRIVPPPRWDSGITETSPITVIEEPFPIVFAVPSVAGSVVVGLCFGEGSMHRVFRFVYYGWVLMRVARCNSEVVTNCTKR